MRRLGTYSLVLLLLILVGNVAYASSSATVVHMQVVNRQPAYRSVATQSLPMRPALPVTTILAPSALDQLTADLKVIAGRSGGRVGINLEELSGPRRTSLSLNGSQSVTAASTYKLPLLMAEAQRIATGQIHGSDIVCVVPGDAEDGWFTDYGPGSCFTRDQLAARVGRYSDNTAAHMLVRELGGGGALNAYAKSIGMSGSALWVPNTTTANDLSQAWVSEALGRLGGATAQQWLYPLLARTATEQGITAGLPRSATVIHKTGWLSATELDAALVINGSVIYVLVVTVDGAADAGGWSAISQVSARVWTYESSRPAFSAPLIPRPAPAPRQNRH